MSSEPCLIHELPYCEDSAGLFAPWAEKPWAVFLDSGFTQCNQGRYDLIAADPLVTLVTRGATTQIATASGVSSSTEDPFRLVKQQLQPATADLSPLPFCGGAIGYFGYDLARRLEKLPSLAKDAEGIPEMVVGIYDWAVVVDHHERRSWLVGRGRDPGTERRWDELIRSFSRIDHDWPDPRPLRVRGPIASNMTREVYARAFGRIHRYLREGDCYQVNLAQRFSARCDGSAWWAYRRLREDNAAPFAAFLNFPQVRILSSSPERFLLVDRGRVESKPIKGTRPRKEDPAADREQIRALMGSAKDRAENLMIVDLLRNDISKSCRKGSVHVPKLFEIETFATVHHLVSTVCGELEPGRQALDLLRSCFPGGSITGAPKIRAMEIIEELEPHRRGAYCGAIGYVGFDGNMDTNIAIRTLVESAGTIRCWAGGGIVFDSVLAEEYQESFDKASAMLKVLEQMRAGDDGAAVGG